MSGYQLGQVVHLAFTVEINDTDTNADQITLTVIRPDGTVDGPFTPTHDGTGVYHYDYAPDRAGLGFRWIAQATGTVQAVATGAFDVYDPTSDAEPLVGVVRPWCDAAAITARPGCAALDQQLLDDAARVASEILYALSGRQFSGVLDGYVRPNARPGQLDPRAWGAAGGYGWYGTWGTCSYAYGTGYGGVLLAGWAGHNCQLDPPQVELGAYPVQSITTVKIDGVTIPADEYMVYDHRLLTRITPTADVTPTERGGWPTCQRLDLPDTEPGTFSVAFTYGTPPPASGRQAATTLAAELALMWSDADNETRLPERVRQLTRQGETIMIADPQDVLDNGRTGIPDVDLFIKSANPAGLQRRAQVWSPDIGRARKPTWSSP